jgi:hypothetical protein
LKNLDLQISAMLGMALGGVLSAFGLLNTEWGKIISRSSELAGSLLRSFRIEFTYVPTLGHLLQVKSVHLENIFKLLGMTLILIRLFHAKNS